MLVPHRKILVVFIFSLCGLWVPGYGETLEPGNEPPSIYKHTWTGDYTTVFDVTGSMRLNLQPEELAWNVDGEDLTDVRVQYLYPEIDLPDRIPFVCVSGFQGEDRHVLHGIVYQGRTWATFRGVYEYHYQQGDPQDATKHISTYWAIPIELIDKGSEYR